MSSKGYVLPDNALQEISQSLARLGNIREVFEGQVPADFLPDLDGETEDNRGWLFHREGLTKFKDLQGFKCSEVG